MRNVASIDESCETIVAEHPEIQPTANIHSPLVG
jgi:hypothetical protein